VTGQEDEDHVVGSEQLMSILLAETILAARQSRSRSWFDEGELRDDGLKANRSDEEEEPEGSGAARRLNRGVGVAQASEKERRERKGDWRR
jgi:hypothetical protein